MVKKDSRGSFLNFWMFATASAMLATPALAETTIDTTGARRYENIRYVGTGHASTFGQTFTAGSDSFLKSFSLFLNGTYGDPMKFKGYVYQWNGTRIIGNELYSSDLKTFDGSALTEFKFDVGSLSLTAGTKYVAFLSVSDFVNIQGSSRASMPAVTNDAYTGGRFVYTYVDADSSKLKTQQWYAYDTSSYDFGDAFFKAEFIASAVPEPATWIMLSLGFGLVGAASRRRTTKATALQMEMSSRSYGFD